MKIYYDDFTFFNNTNTNNKTIMVPDNYKYMEVKEIQITNLFYNIDTYNNVINIDSVDYTLTEGNYSMSDLVNKLNTLVVGLSFAYNNITGKMSISKASNFNLGYTSLLHLIGFRVPQSGNNNYTSSHVIDLNERFRSLSLISGFKHVKTRVGDNRNFDTLLKIHNNVNFGENIIMESNRQHKYRISGGHFNTQTIKLLDRFGNELDKSNIVYILFEFTE